MVVFSADFSTMERKSEFNGSKYLESNSNYFNNKYITFFKNLPITKTSKCRMVLKSALRKILCITISWAVAGVTIHQKYGINHSKMLQRQHRQIKKEFSMRFRKFLKEKSDVNFSPL